jgi:hypothetical protein
VFGESKDGPGVFGNSNFDAGVSGDGLTAGVHGRGSQNGVWGVSGSEEHQTGVRGEGATGVYGISFVTDHAGVFGEHTGIKGHGTVGIGKGPLGAGVLGRNEEGYGGQFEGGKAQLMLKPGGSAGMPATGKHKNGEIYMDSAGTLFVCVAKGTPGTWKEIATTSEDTTTPEDTTV